MIAPDMATMLCFIFTDAAIAQPALQSLLSAHVRTTFNCMTIDSDTSTSDTCLVFATGAAAKRGQQSISDPGTPHGRPSVPRCTTSCAISPSRSPRTARAPSKFVTFEVAGAESWAAARTIGLACANSPLLKSAIFGEDPNWGRVVMAVGKSGEAADRDKLSIWFGDSQVAKDGERAPGYDEKTVAGYMKGREIKIRIDLRIGSGSATVWTCDLTHDYISINADYRS